MSYFDVFAIIDRVVLSGSILHTTFLAQFFQVLKVAINSQQISSNISWNVKYLVIPPQTQFERAYIGGSGVTDVMKSRSRAIFVLKLIFLLISIPWGQRNRKNIGSKFSKPRNPVYFSGFHGNPKYCYSKLPMVGKWVITLLLETIESLNKKQSKVDKWYLRMMYKLINIHERQDMNINEKVKNCGKLLKNQVYFFP